MTEPAGSIHPTPAGMMQYLLDEAIKDGRVRIWDEASGTWKAPRPARIEAPTQEGEPQ